MQQPSISLLIEKSMKSIINTLLVISSLSVSAEAIEVNEQKHKIEITTSTLECKGFSINSITKSFPFTVRESQLSYDKTMGHYGNPHLISQELTYASKQTSLDITGIYKRIKSYSKIDPSRPYITTPVKCIENTRILLSFWGGGNCNTVCEAYALVSFTENGAIKEIKGLQYQEFNKLKSN